MRAGQSTNRNREVSRVKRLLSIVAILTLAACYCFPALAEGEDVILHMQVDAVVAKDGDMLVEQTAQYPGNLRCHRH